MRQIRERFIGEVSMAAEVLMIDARTATRQCVVARTPAKVNLFLELLAKRPDGYHELETVMVPVSCFDTLQITRSEKHQEIHLRTHWWPSAEDWKESLGDAAEPLLAIPNDASNLIHRAISEVKAAFDVPYGFEAVVRKRIPAGAGMGGASSDAAAAILATAALGKVAATDPELGRIAQKIGSDVPFFLGDGAALATGRGEKLQSVKLGRRLWFVVAFPRGGLSTAAVFGRAQIPERPVRPDDCLAALTSGDLGALNSGLVNRLSHPARLLSPLVSDLLSLMESCGSSPAMMTGSGSACFSVFQEREEARRAARQLRQQWSRTPVPGRVLVVSSVAARPRLRACF
jgi:4-diphosphocytidyl-2-C-methyl-D-erythritol kinase